MEQKMIAVGFMALRRDDGEFTKPMTLLVPETYAKGQSNSVTNLAQLLAKRVAQKNVEKQNA